MGNEADAADEFVIMPAKRLSELISRAVQKALGGQQHNGPLLVDKQQLAQQLGCSAAHVDHLRKRGLPTVRVGQVVRFEPSTVLEWLKANGAGSNDAR